MVKVLFFLALAVIGVSNAVTMEMHRFTDAACAISAKKRFVVEAYSTAIGGCMVGGSYYDDKMRNLMDFNFGCTSTQFTMSVYRPGATCSDSMGSSILGATQFDKFWGGQCTHFKATEYWKLTNATIAAPVCNLTMSTKGSTSAARGLDFQTSLMISAVFPVLMVMGIVIA